VKDTHFPVKGQKTSNPGQDPEIKDCPGKSRMDGHLKQRHYARGGPNQWEWEVFTTVLTGTNIY